MRRSGDRAESSVWTGVVELGGTVESLRGDTLTIQPYYVLAARMTPSGDVKIIRFSDIRVLPDVVFIPAAPGFRVDSPNETRPKGPGLATLVILGLIALDLYSRWPRG